MYKNSVRLAGFIVPGSGAIYNLRFTFSLDPWGSRIMLSLQLAKIDTSFLLYSLTKVQVVLEYVLGM